MSGLNGRSRGLRRLPIEIDAGHCSLGALEDDVLGLALRCAWRSCSKTRASTPGRSRDARRAVGGGVRFARFTTFGTRPVSKRS